MTASEPAEQPRAGPAQAGHALGSGARGAGRAVAGVARGTGRPAGSRCARRGGPPTPRAPDTSGLSRLIEMHAFNAAGDAAVAISLAGTLFFQVPTGEARGQVALFLGLTMLPFAIVAPLIGPFLDRFSHGRRWAIGATMAVRAFLVLGARDGGRSESTWLFPAALGCLVASKAYGVDAAAAVPRLLPENLTLVKANARLSLAGVVGATVSAPIAGLASPGRGRVVAALRVRALRAGDDLGDPAAAQVDSDAGRGPGSLLPGDDEPIEARHGADADPRPRGLRAARATAGRAGCRASSPCSWRSCCGRTRSAAGAPRSCSAIVIGAAGLGNALGIALASLLRKINPALTVVLALVADAVDRAAGGRLLRRARRWPCWA